MVMSDIMTDTLEIKQMLLLIFLEPGCEDKTYSHEIMEKRFQQCVLVISIMAFQRKKRYRRAVGT